MSQLMKLPAIKKKKSMGRRNRKLLTLLLLFFMVILVILFFNSSFSRIQTIEISGQHYLSEEQIGQALGVFPDDQFFAVSSRTLEEHVGQLEIVQSVRVQKQFPGLIIVEVKEYPEVAYNVQENSQKVLLSNGSIIELEEELLLMDKPIATGWNANDPLLPKLSEALLAIPPELLADISEIKPVPSVSYPDRIKLYTRSFFEVITTINYLPEQIHYLDEVISDLQSKGSTSGVITMLEVITYTPFDREGTEEPDERE